MAVLMNLTASAQNFAIERNDTTFYCIIESTTDSLIKSYNRDKINRDIVIKLRNSQRNWITERESLNRALLACQLANDATVDMVELSEEETALTKRELRRMKMKAVGDFFKNQWQLLTVGGGALGVGVTVGYLAK